MKNLLLLLLFLGAGSFAGLTQNSTRPKLFFREDWKEIRAATPVTQEHVANKDLMRGGQSLACSRVDWIEIYGKAVRR